MRRAMLVDGTKMNGPSSLREALVRYSPQFVRVVTEKLMTYALGRGVEYYDMPLVRSIVRDAATKQLQVLVARSGNREERTVPDEYEGARATAYRSVRRKQCRNDGRRSKRSR